MKRPLFTGTDAAFAALVVAAMLVGAGSVLLVTSLVGLYCIQFSCGG